MAGVGRCVVTRPITAVAAAAALWVGTRIAGAPIPADLGLCLWVAAVAPAALAVARRMVTS